MTDAVQEQVQVTEEGSRNEDPVADRAAGVRMFKYSDWVHVGEGAVECELAGAGKCQSLDEATGKVVNIAQVCDDPEHFHAYTRLPNKFQQKDIYDKAMAAKSRRMRSMRDTESDAFHVLEAEIDEMRHVIDDVLIDELIAKDWAEDYLSAVRDVDEVEEFEHIAQDREKYQAETPEWKDKPEEEWPSEYADLHRHINAYVDAITAKVKENQEPKREAIAAKGHDGIVDLLRDDRIERAGIDQFAHVTAEWTWFVGTLFVQPDAVMRRPYTRRFTSLEEMHGQSPEVIDALKLSYDALELALRRASGGNS